MSDWLIHMNSYKNSKDDIEFRADEDCFELGLKVLEFIQDYFPDYPPTCIINDCNCGVIIERTSKNCKHTCELNIKDATIQCTIFKDCIVKEIGNIELQDLQLLDGYWNYN